ncbi:MAG: cadherin repeat domain-containing protein [Rubripirellula sp.]
MNERERFLSILVAGLLIATGVWWCFGNYNQAVQSRQNQIDQLVTTQAQLNEKRLLGELANRQMGEYMLRSLPGDPEQAQSKYQQWLLDLVQDSDLTQALVDANSSRTIGGLYQLLDFRVRGNSDVPGVLKLMYSFYSKDYLHRIRDLSLLKNRQGGFQLEMSIDVIALLGAPNDLPLREEPSWRIDGDLAAYLDPIMNRNLYEPPNQPPKFGGRSEVEAIVGRDTPTPLAFKDPDGHRMRYELVEGPYEFVSIDSSSGTLRIRSDQTTEFDVTVRATDNGYPSRSSEQRLVVKVLDPPPPEPEPEPPAGFDDASQTVLTALVQGRNEWTAWLHVRTKDETIKLKVGDTFEIGSILGSVKSVSARSAILEVAGSTLELEPSGNLLEAASAISTSIQP